MSERPLPAIDARTYQRRRLGVLAAVLALVLAASPVLAGGGAGDDVVEVAASASTPPAPVDLGPVRLAAVSRALAAPQTVVTTTTEAAATLETQAPEPTTTEPAPPVTTAPAPTTSTTAVPTTTAPPTTAAPSTTVPPAASTPAPAPVATAPPTTAAPAPPPTTAATDPADPGGTQVWHDLARCESGGRWSIDSGNGYYGGLQFSLGSWRAVGGSGHPHEHPAETQIEMGRRLQASQGWGAWPHCSSQLGLR